MNHTKSSLRLGIVLALSAIPVFAHHPFAADFDWKKSVTVVGTVTAVKVESPHSIVSIATAKVGTTVSNWAVELGSPKVLAKYGWPANIVKIGDKITVEGWLASNGQKIISARTVKISDGTVLFGASSFFDLPFRASHGETGICVSDDACLEMETKISQR